MQLIVNKKNPLWKKRKQPPTYLEVRCIAHGGASPSTLVPWLVATAPPLNSDPLHPFPTPSVPLHYLQGRSQQSQSSSSGTVTLSVLRKEQCQHREKEMRKKYWTNFVRMCFPSLSFYDVDCIYRHDRVFFLLLFRHMQHLVTLEPRTLMWRRRDAFVTWFL